jgi:lipid II:glycine glycyltransferase (peptidoglycan interpeptide bridge formation enzyme)
MTFDAASTYDARAWDEFVSSQSAGHFMQCYAWGDFQRQLGWKPHYCVLKDQDGIRGAALLLSRSVPGAGRVFNAPRGPVVDISDQQTTATLLSHISSYVKQQGGIFMRCDPYWTETDVNGTQLPAEYHRVPRDWSYWNAPRFVFWLDLNPGEEPIMMLMAGNNRNQIRKGYKVGVEFKLGTDEDLEDFYRMMVLTGQQKGIAFHSPDYYRKLYATVNASAKVQLFLGRLNGDVVTAGMSVIYGKKAWLLYAASAPQHYKLRVNRTLQWEMVRWAIAQGCERYDFRGTATNDPPSTEDPGYGVYEFKRSFMPEFTRLAGYYDSVQRPLRYKMFRLAEERMLPLAYRVKTWLQDRKSH